ncbi:MAG: glycosyltransferase family 4 protein, partial [Chloroflexota bacterium]|nr:glycosyltransferase family 4 protein [Chloroflexota bacterium]
FHVHSAEWGRQPGGPSPIVSHWEMAAGRAAAATITVSQAMVRDLIAHGWDADRVHGVWNGVDTQGFSPDAPGGAELRERYGLPDDAPVVFFIGRLTGVKGARPLIEGWPRVVAQHPEARLVALGTGDQDDEIRGLVAGLGIEDSVTLRTEWVSEAERIAHFAAADLVVLPSTYEPFGIVCLEAMACGKPVVVGARGVVGFREQVMNEGPNQCGLHVNGADPVDIAWGLGEALRDGKRMRRWGRNGRERAVSMFTWARCAARTAEVYERVG